MGNFTSLDNSSSSVGVNNKAGQMVYPLGQIKSRAVESHRLVLATEGGHLEITQLLLKNGAKTNYQNCVGLTALLIMATRKGHLEITQLLLYQGARIDHQDRTTGMTPLMLAAKEGHLETTQLFLLDQGAEINHQDRAGMMALILAAKEGHWRSLVGPRC
jgi:ankyrin repeat protein